MLQTVVVILEYVASSDKTGREGHILRLRITLWLADYSDIMSLHMNFILNLSVKARRTTCVILRSISLSDVTQTRFDEMSSTA